MVAHGRTNNKDHSYHCCEAKAFVALQILVCSLNVGGGRDGSSRAGGEWGGPFPEEIHAVYTGGCKRPPSFRLNSRVEFLLKEKCGFQRNTVTK